MVVPKVTATNEVTLSFVDFCNLCRDKYFDCFRTLDLITSNQNFALKLPHDGGPRNSKFIQSIFTAFTVRLMQYIDKCFLSDFFLLPKC